MYLSQITVIQENTQTCLGLHLHLPSSKTKKLKLFLKVTQYILIFNGKVGGLIFFRIGFSLTTFFYYHQFSN